jgi:hypothetical protein
MATSLPREHGAGLDEAALWELTFEQAVRLVQEEIRGEEFEAWLDRVSAGLPRPQPEEGGAA